MAKGRVILVLEADTSAFDDALEKIIAGDILGAQKIMLAELTRAEADKITEYDELIGELPEDPNG